MNQGENNPVRKEMRRKCSAQIGHGVCFSDALCFRSGYG